MKMKCPFCQEEVDDLRKHLIEKALIEDVVDLYLFERVQREKLERKIHEKIEMLQIVNQPYALRLLESLLE